MSEATGIIAPSAEAAQAEQDRRRGPNMRLKPGRAYRLRLLPAFKATDGRGIWFSVKRKHWKIPVPGTTDSKTFTCPKELPGGQCYVCDMAETLKPTLPQMAKDFAPNLSYMFNVLDADNPGFGVQQLEDGATLFNLFLGLIQAMPTIADPEQGQVINVAKVSQSPWRTAVPAGVLPFSTMGVDIDVAYPANLPDLDEAWNYIEYEEQQQLFSAIATNPHAIAASMGTQGQIAPAPAFPAAAISVPAPVAVPGPVSVAPAPVQPATTVAVAPPAGPAPAAVVPAPAPVAAEVTPESADLQAQMVAAASASEGS